MSSVIFGRLSPGTQWFMCFKFLWAVILSGSQNLNRYNTRLKVLLHPQGSQKSGPVIIQSLSSSQKFIKRLLRDSDPGLGGQSPVVLRSTCLHLFPQQKDVISTMLPNFNAKAALCAGVTNKY